MKRVFLSITVLIIIGAVVFIWTDLYKEETFKIIQKETESGIIIESNKLLKPSYKQATVNLKETEITSNSANEIDASNLAIGDKIKAEFGPVTGLSNPPVLNAKKIILLD